MVFVRYGEEEIFSANAFFYFTLTIRRPIVHMLHYTEYQELSRCSCAFYNEKNKSEKKLEKEYPEARSDFYLDVYDKNIIMKL